MCGSEVRWVSLTYCNRQPAARSASVSLLDAETGQVAGTELQVELLTRGLKLEFPQWAAARAVALFDQRHLFEGFRVEQLGRIGALQLGGHGFQILRLGDAEAAGADVQRGVAEAARVLPDRRQQVVLTLLQQRFVGDSAGVTIRTTLRSTGPLLVAGSPICSQMATDSPSCTSLAGSSLPRGAARRPSGSVHPPRRRAWSAKYPAVGKRAWRRRKTARRSRPCGRTAGFQDAGP